MCHMFARIYIFPAVRRGWIEGSVSFGVWPRRRWNSAWQGAGSKIFDAYRMQLPSRLNPPLRARGVLLKSPRGNPKRMGLPRLRRSRAARAIQYRDFGVLARRSWSDAPEGGAGQLPPGCRSPIRAAFEIRFPRQSNFVCGKYRWTCIKSVHKRRQRLYTPGKLTCAAWSIRNACSLRDAGGQPMRRRAHHRMTRTFCGRPCAR